MENLPVEVIGNILSRLGAAHDVVVASATCRKWRDAFRKHLHLLSFNYNEWPVYRDLTTSRLEILITQTIFQTTGLQGLTILMDDVEDFSASTVIAWLMYTRESLRRLNYNVRTLPTLNILDVCGRQRLEMLSLAHNSIPGVDPNYQRFVNLTSLSLSHVNISALDLSLLINACPKIETLALVSPEIDMLEALVTVELTSSTLKSIYVEAMSLDKFIVEADELEKLHLKDCALELLELIGNGKLMQFILDDVSIIHLDIGDTVESLEVVDVSNFTIYWPKFYYMIYRSSNLRVLRLSEVTQEDEDEIVELESIATRFPQLSHLTIYYDLRVGALQYNFEGSYLLQNVTKLEVGWTILTDVFAGWIEELLLRCPQLKKLIINGNVSDTKTHEDCQVLARFTSFVVRLMRKYIHIDVQFDYE